MQQEIKSKAGERTHTPGPWIIGRHLMTGMPHIRTTTTDIADCCESNRTPKEWEANARLIAAAPELLDALESVMPRCQHAEEDEQSFKIIPCDRLATHAASFGEMLCSECATKQGRGNQIACLVSAVAVITKAIGI